MGSVPGTTTFSSQSVASILDATLLLYAVVINKIDFDCLFWTFHYCQLVFFHTHVVLLFILLSCNLNSVACAFVTCFQRILKNTQKVCIALLG